MVKTCNDIDKICRDFLLGDKDNCKKVHLVNWREICVPRENGGLGLWMVRDFNFALLAKLAWQIIACSNKFWVWVMCDKYVRDGNFFAAPVPSNMPLGVGEASLKGTLLLSWVLVGGLGMGDHLTSNLTGGWVWGHSVWN